MPGLPKAARRLRGRTSAVDLDTEAGRTFYQERIGLFNKVSFLISGAFFLAGALLSPLYAPFMQTGADAWRQPLVHVATLLVNLSGWLLCVRRPGLPPALLQWVDAGSLVLPLLGFSFQTPFVPRAFTGEVAEALVLILTNMAIARAVLVPATAAHTARTSLLAALPVVLASAGLPPSPGLPPALDALDRVWAVLWSLCAVVVATLASHVIYGLREEVRKARRLGQYTLEEKLGEGGMGTVYRARHALLRRPTAIKLLPPDKAGAVALGRFEREVQLTAALSHPNTVSVFDYGRTPDGVFYYVMEYLEGTNLEGLVREDGPQPPARVAHVLQQVASALVEAHGVGLIHRDVKPENIILCERGGVPDVAKVVDFGLARDLERGDQARLTQQNVVQGTPLYLSPEAIRAPDAVDARSDLYSLGAVGYYLVTGQHVFGGATLVEVCSHHLHTRPILPSERLGRPVPPGLEALLLACLEKDPARRPASAVELRSALTSLAGLGTWGEDEARQWWSRWRELRAGRAASRTESGTRTVSIVLGEREELDRH
jgi:serine/threonine-protein kinase